MVTNWIGLFLWRRSSSRFDVAIPGAAHIHIRPSNWRRVMRTRCSWMRECSALAACPTYWLYSSAADLIKMKKKKSLFDWQAPIYWCCVHRAVSHWNGWYCAVFHTSIFTLCGCEKMAAPFHVWDNHGPYFCHPCFDTTLQYKTCGIRRGSSAVLELAQSEMAQSKYYIPAGRTKL